MKPGDSTHIGDGAYVSYDGNSFRFSANHHEADQASDNVFVELQHATELIAILFRTLAINQDNETPPGELEKAYRLHDLAQGPRGRINLCPLCKKPRSHQEIHGERTD